MAPGGMAPGNAMLPAQPPQTASPGANPGAGPGATSPSPSQNPNQASAPNPTPDQASATPGATEEKRGFLNGLGQWWKDSMADWDAKMKEQQNKLDEFNKQQSEAAKNATEAMKKAADAMFSPSKVVEVQQTCPIAGNGAPDCASAATNVCKTKGFSDGKPIDIRTAERCKASLWVSGQSAAVACPIETVLLRVACQP
jgi:hypothetical protein